MSQTETLTPPDQSALQPPAAVAPIEKEKAASIVPVTDEQRHALDEKVDEFINIVVSVDVNSEQFQDKVRSIHSMGSDKIREAASISNRMLERPVRAINDGILDGSSPIGKSLVELRSTVEDLDPSKQGDLLSPKKLLGLIPFGNKLKDYFDKYQSAQTHINAIIQSLYNGQDELKKDNASIEVEKARLWDTMGMLEQYAYVGKEIDQALETRVAQIESENPEKARVVKEEMLFYVRQKVQDLLTQLAVSVQGYMALDMIRKNNLELIKGVDRATTTTVSALRTAVIVAQALTNQKLVLDQIAALNTTTSNMIASTAAMLKQQASAIGEQASSSTIELDKLKSAFSDIYATMDMMADYKVKALGNMQQTVDALTTEIDKSKAYLDRIREQEAAEQTAASDSVSSNEVHI
ncbi:toxic anion resistance protein [Thiosocius teredinicola]|uniref:toxic anion resistance protein n=1 Tax=Thiosocius teredinicola TaxID=1973002 RepID=UPI000990A207